MTAAAPSPEISLVVTAHNEEANLEPLCVQLASVLEEAATSREIVRCDDGSTDRTSG